jgi:hypothetical protein
MNKCKADKTQPLNRCFKAETMQQLNNIKLSRRKKLDYLEQFMCINIILASAGISVLPVYMLDFL